MRMAAFLAVLSGALTVFAFAPFGASPLAFVSLVPLLIALDGKSRKDSFLLGWLWGAAFFLGTVYWVVRSISMYGGVPVAAAIAVMLLLVAYLALFPALFAAALTWLRSSRPIIRLLFVPAAWVAVEYLRGLTFLGFPWVLAGYSQLPFLPLVQIADITGVWGVSFVVVMVNETVAAFVRSRRAALPSPVREAVVAASVVVAVVLYGVFRISQVDTVTSVWEKMKVGIVQGNIDQGQKWSEDLMEFTVDTYTDMSEGLIAEGAELVVWPETAMPFLVESDKKYGPRVRDISDEHGVNLLTGSMAYGYTFEGGKYRYFNSAYLYATDWAVPVRYDKVRLVPFGEYVPFKKVLPFLDKLTEGAVGDYAPGGGHFPLRFEGQALGVLICYEAIFPSISRQSIKMGATVLVNLTNDSWFGRTSAPYQHMEIARLRAVENRVYLIRAANSGISAIVDPAGRVVAKTSLFKQETLLGEVGFNPLPSSLFTAWGPVFPLSCLFLTVVFVIEGLVGRDFLGRKFDLKKIIRRI